MVNIFKQKWFVKQQRGRLFQKKHFGKQERYADICQNLEGTLANANIKEEYIIEAIETDNDEMKDFLFTLGCYEGEAITVISILSDQYVVVIKDARYSIDQNLASCIII